MAKKLLELCREGETSKDVYSRVVRPLTEEELLTKKGKLAEVKGYRATYKPVFNEVIQVKGVKISWAKRLPGVKGSKFEEIRRLAKAKKTQSFALRVTQYFIGGEEEGQPATGPLAEVLGLKNWKIQKIAKLGEKGADVILVNEETGDYAILEFKTHWEVEWLKNDLTRKEVFAEALNQLLKYCVKEMKERGRSPAKAFLVHLYVDVSKETEGEAIAVVFELGKPTRQLKLFGE